MIQKSSLQVLCYLLLVLLFSNKVHANYAVVEQHFAEKDCGGEAVFQLADVQATLDIVNANTTSYIEPYLCWNVDHNQSSRARVLTSGNWYFFKTANGTSLKDVVEAADSYFAKSSCQLIHEDFWNCTNNGKEEILVVKVPDIPWMYYLAGVAVVMAANTRAAACCQGARSVPRTNPPTPPPFSFPRTPPPNLG